VVNWIAPACLALIFLLQVFFPWVGYYWGGHGVFTQGPWFAAVGWYNAEKAWEEMSGVDIQTARPHFSPLLLFYLLLFLLTLALSIVSAVVTVLPPRTVQLPPAVQQILPWRWAIVGGLCVLVFLLLSLQLLAGFSAESQAHVAAVEKVSKDPEHPKTDEEQALRIGKEYNALGVQRTTWLRLAFILHLVAIAGAGLAFWVDYRGTTRPLPYFALRW
jgi:hypothetical protein